MKILFDLMAKHSEAEGQLLTYDIGNQRFLKVTDRCNLNCIFCPKKNIGEAGDDQLNLPDEPSLTKIIDIVCGTGSCREVIFSGLGEPTYRLYDILKAARYLQNKGIRAVLHTNGLADRIHDRTIAPDLEDNIDEVNISINAHTAEVYEKVSRPSIDNAFQSVIDFVKSARDYVPIVNISATRGISDINIDSCKALAEELQVGFVERTLSRPC